ncbi:hypothetical protein [Parendozoicomonas haliclonae]|uniref:Secreted protein n=1 Tax=Parendozoicomonas haliclonae TaxID=1960125 RepID=A0A1X7ALE8_9GAMM|nr:hypothetical protein [Parendozoicomonas haliclonae]SMA48397.1 hypothetical protein EHSB41UT_02724 [Parendozoicomonas haliclonae]
MNNTLKIAAIAAFSTLLAACTTQSPTVSEIDPSLSLSDRAYSIKTQQACEAESGTWRKVGRLQAFACVLPTADAGKACTDSSECQVGCIVEEHVEPGTKVVGQCMSSTHRFGCNTMVTNGVVEGTLCID